MHQQNDIEYARALIEFGYKITPIHRPVIKPEKYDRGTCTYACSCSRGKTCTSVGKHPVLSGWPEKAQEGSLQNGEYLGYFAGANIGIVTDELLVLDVDGEPGRESLETLVSQHGGLPDTPTVLTGSLGYHFYFEAPDNGHALKSSTGQIGTNLDIKVGEKSYVVAPNSIHASGRNYEWCRSPWDVGLAKAPDWLVQCIIDAKGEKCNSPAMNYPEGDLGESDHNVDLARKLIDQALIKAVESGSRHSGALHLAVQARDNRYGIKAAACMLQVYVDDCPSKNHAFTHNEALQCLNWAYNQPARDYWSSLQRIPTIRDGKLEHQLIDLSPKYTRKTSIIELNNPNADVTDARNTKEKKGVILNPLNTAEPPVEELSSPDSVGSVDSVEKQNGNEEKNEADLKGRGGFNPADITDIFEDIELFLGNDGEAYLSFDRNNHRETHRIGNQSLKNIALTEWHKKTATFLSPSQIDSANTWFLSNAHVNGSRHTVWIRSGEDEKGNLYLDLGREDWRVVKITPLGWEVIDKSPIHFIRSPSLGELPIPTAGEGNINLLRKYVHVQRDDDFKLIAGITLGHLQPNGPYPILVIWGEQDSGKSETCKLIRQVIDPSLADARSMPGNERDLMIAAFATKVLLFDNVSSIPTEMSDSLCRLATGATFSTRRLYSDKEEMNISACRPIIANGVSDFITREDLRSRSLFVKIASIQDEKRLTEKALIRDFNHDHPLILAGFLNAAVIALREFDKVNLTSLPRMADFCQWVTAGESAIGCQRGEFLELYKRNSQAAAEESLDGNAIAEALIKLLKDHQGQWQGTMSELRGHLAARLDEEFRRTKEWPKNARWLRTRLEEIGPMLRKAAQITMEFTQKKTRVVTLRMPFEQPAAGKLLPLSEVDQAPMDMPGDA